MPVRPADEHFRPGLSLEGRGVDALNRLASELRDAYQSGRITLAQAIDGVARGIQGARNQLVRAVRSAEGVDGHCVGHEDIEDAIAEVTVGLRSLFENWTGGSFGSYFIKAARNKLVDQYRKTYREAVTAEGEVEGSVEASFPSDDGRRAILTDVQVANRFIWYVYGSPDNPNRISSSKSIADMMALKWRVEERQPSELVQNCQPRVGEWGPGQGEPDNKWWRSRATFAQNKIFTLLASPEYLAQYERIRSSLRDVR